MNKVLGAILGTCLFLVALNITAGAIFTPEKMAKAGYEIAVPEHPEGGGTGPAAAPAEDPPLASLVAKADVARGEKAAQKCAACHTFDKGGRVLVGPNLWGVIGRPKASVAGFNYSAAIKAMGGNWSADDVYHFIANPKGMIPGTAMTFAGVPRPSERADIISFLNTKSDSPAPLPKAAEAAPAGQ